MLNPKEIGYRIKQRREELGLTLEDIASQVKVARSTIQRYEAGSISRPKLPVLHSVSQALHVSPDWLLGITDDPTPVVSIGAGNTAQAGSGEAAGLNAERRAFVDRVKAWDDATFHRVVAVIDAVLGEKQ